MSLTSHSLNTSLTPVKGCYRRKNAIGGLAHFKTGLKKERPHSRSKRQLDHI